MFFCRQNQFLRLALIMALGTIRHNVAKKVVTREDRKALQKGIHRYLYDVTHVVTTHEDRRRVDKSWFHFFVLFFQKSSRNFANSKISRRSTVRISDSTQIGHRRLFSSDALNLQLFWEDNSVQVMNPGGIVHLPIDYRCDGAKHFCRVVATSWYHPITYYWTVPQFLDHTYLVGRLTSSKIADTKVSGFKRF